MRFENYFTEIQKGRCELLFFFCFKANIGCFTTENTVISITFARVHGLCTNFIYLFQLIGEYHFFCNLSLLKNE